MNPEQESLLPEAPRAFDIWETLRGASPEVKSFDNQILSDFMFDVNDGMEREEALSLYPEFSEDYIDDLIFDTQDWADENELLNLYPEIWGKKEKEEETDSIPEYITKEEANESTIFEKLRKVNDFIDTPARLFTEGAIWLAKNTKDSVVGIAQANADLGQNLWDSLAEWITWKELIDPTTDTTISENFLDIWAGSLNVWLTVGFPWTSLLMSTASETEAWKAVLLPIAEAITSGWSIINKFPWLSNYRDSLPEDRREDFDAFVWQASTLGLIKAWSAGKTALINRYKTNSASAVTKTVRGTPKEFELGIAQGAEKGIVRALKDSGKKPSTYTELKTVVKEQLWKFEKKLNETISWIDKKNVELWNKTFWGKHPSVKWAIEQLKEVYKNGKSVENKQILKDVMLLEKAFEAWTVTVENIQKLKRIHTSANKLFNDSWVSKGTLDAKDLWNIRKDLKVLIEENWKITGSKNIEKINWEYWEVLNANQIVWKRVNQAKSYFAKADNLSVFENVLADTFEVVKAPLIKVLRAKSKGQLNVAEAESFIIKISQELTKAWASTSKIAQVKKLILEGLPMTIKESIKKTPLVPNTED